MGLARVLFLAGLFCGSMVSAEPLRIATFNVALDRAGPGILYRDLLRSDDDVRAAAMVIAEAAPDILLLTRFDYDLDGLALSEFGRLILGAGGPDYVYRFALRPNSGWATGLDLDGDGLLGGPGDAQGYGEFAGQGGMAILSRFPVQEEGVRDFSRLLWRDLPGAVLPVRQGSPFYRPEATAVLRLSSVGHWVVPIDLPGGGSLWVGAYHATTPVFDGPEDRNGLRNRDENRFWSQYLDGAFGAVPDRFVLLGDANLDPYGGDGQRQAIRQLLLHPRLQDPLPKTPWGDQATALWKSDPGPLRVDYVLPSTELAVAASGLTGTGDGSGLGARLAEAGLHSPIHRLVWVDVEIDP